MGAYKYIRETLQAQYKQADERYKEKVREWRHGNAIAAVEYPANLDRARRLGYKAKQGYKIVRVRMEKGRRRRVKPMGGRKPRHNYRYVQPQLSHQGIAEQRANRLHRNMEVLNSYWAGEDGNYKYFEVIMADASRATVRTTSVSRKGKSFRGLTSVGKKARGLRKAKVKPTHSRSQ